MLHHLSPSPTLHEPDTSAEWEYLRGEQLWIFGSLLALAAVLVPALEQVQLGPLQIDLLGLLLCLTVLLTLGAARSRPAMAPSLLVAGMLCTVALFTFWQPSAGALVLFVFPVGTATLLLGGPAAFATALATVALIGGAAGADPASRTAAGLAVAFVWLVGWLAGRARRELVEKLMEYYTAARTALQEARDRQLALNQANDDIANAYTHLARLNELLQASRLEAELARGAKEQFVANVSHELRTPLNMIIGFSELIQNAAASNPQLPPELLADLGVIHRNSQHLAQLIDDVLDLSQLEAGQMSLRREPVQPVTLVAEAVEAVRPLYQAKGLSLTTTLPASLPVAFWDRLRVRQVLLNLLSNAGRFTAQGGVSLAVRAPDSEIVISVHDTGPGIAPKDQQRIFEPFEQVDGSIKREFSGTGLGLNISKRLVELHGGRLWVESGLGAGSTFYVVLPCQAVQDEPAAATRWVNPYTFYEPPARKRVTPLPRPRPRVVVLEGEDVLHHQTQVYLRDAEVVHVATLDDLCADVQHTPPHLVIVNDPQVMEGRTSLRSLLKLPPRTPIVSCYVPGLREACERLNVVDYLIKPVEEPELRAAAARLAPAGATILIVEDDAEMARLITRQLSAAGSGYRLLRATQGRRALELMRSRRPDAILMDLGLPGLDGYEVLVEKNGDPAIAPIPVTIVSARDPLGAPVLTSRLRLELPGGLSARDVILTAAAVSQALSPQARSLVPESPANLPG